MTGVELRGLVWAAGQPHQLEVDPLRVAGGEIGVIVASPAAGSALADVLVGLARPLRGTVRVRGVSVTGRPPGERGITLVPCGGGLLPHLTVERNVGFGLDGKVARAARHARVTEVLGALQLASLRRLRPHEISPEQQLRVALARAMCAHAETVAVVVEDSCGPVSCRVAAMTAAEQELSVLLITDEPDRVRGIPRRAWAVCRRSQPGGEGPDADQP
jgi:ABC-type sugar transport system ATPase subunit